ncbi:MULTISPECIES: YtxH domain-containing protein [Cyclobacterium]|uniref:YtxH domain-containing protein n=1 Tax=Cyclobacterium plantarum TaxID=2716263 RepID=A0ABX0HFB3_9BACT|nr:MULTISPECIES: YtxH domain-containing protein [Cyclobacterium]MBD3628379.1 YtxH domain-containing protein [Cyclobacterium sp.]NHE59066.1 YtxH domain-containing protein [Cyclobacterium plantarum]
MSKKTNSIFVFALGAGIGAVLGVLYAPDSGNNTRDKLSYRLGKYRNELEDLIDDLVEGKSLPDNLAKSEGDKVITEAKSKAENLLNDVNKLIDQINKENNNN